MSQLLVAIKSSAAEMEAGAHDKIRGTDWYKTMRGRSLVRFFIGQQTDGMEGRVIVGSRKRYNFKSDELALDIADHPAGAVFKTRAIAQYAVGKNIDHILMVDTSSTVIPEKVWASHYKIADYSGIFDGGWGQRESREVSGHVIERCYSWASGKAGYFLSQRAAFEIADASVRVNQYIVGTNDDLWVGQILGPLCANGDLFSIQLDESVCE